MKFIKKFIKSRRGAVFMLVGLGFFSMVGVTATAIDFSRGMLLRSELISTLDAAALAGGTVANSGNLNNMVNKYYNVNLPAGYLGATIEAPSVSLADDRQTLTISAAAHLKNSMMQVVHWDMANFAANTEVTLERKGMELVLVLDNTGSMNESAGNGGGVTKLDALKTASASLVNILYGNNTTVDNLWVGLVPFSQAVNVGAARTSWTQSTAYNWGPASWEGCVEAREASNRDTTDDPPSTATFPKYYSACAPYTYTWSNSWFGTNTARTNCLTGTGLKYRTPFSVDLGPNQYCTKPLTPMVSDKNTILSQISQMSAGGDTMINLGLVWGWRMLSPRWRNLWGGEMNTAGLPLEYNTPLMTKVVILLSDGDNRFTASNYTAYGLLSDGSLGTTSSSTAASRLNQRTTAVCNSMKANNILIYTVALGSSITSTGKSLLQGCASRPEYYFESPTGDDLQEAFHAIGDSLSNLRISK